MQLGAQTLADCVGCTVDRAAKWLPHIQAAIERFGIEGANNVAMFLAQCAHESAHFARIEEGLNYSADGLAATWPKRFAVNGKPNSLAMALHRKPEAIANAVYANRMGNGDEASGDGWRFRGRGLIQVTGRENYTKCGQAIGADLAYRPDMLLLVDFAALSAGWFWKTHGLNEIGAAGDVLAATKVINGGTVGLKEREQLFRRALQAIKEAN